MFHNLGSGEVLVLLLLALFLFGPDRLPGVIRDTAKGARQVRRYLSSMSQDLRDELGPELGGLDLAALRDPQAFVRKHLWNDEEDVDDAPPARNAPRAVQAGGSFPLVAGETPPWDPDTT